MSSPSVSPASLSVPASPRTRSSSGVVWATALVGLLVGVLAAAGFYVLRARRGTATSAASAASAVVRVVLTTRAGTGFFVGGPDGLAYVVTASHVVDSGEPILVERTVDGGGGEQWVEAYPGAEVVAFDEDADLAVLRLEGVSAERFVTLPLATEPVRDEAILSYGFGASSLASRSGMVSKPGKILSLVKFPVVDRVTGETIRSDAVDGLLISSEIEPGFSGGPTVNERGQVVGVNVSKDTVHRAQNGAVSVAAIRSLLARVAPKTQDQAPSPAEVGALLQRIQEEYLLLPLERRSSARAEEYVSTADMPRLEELVTTVHHLENDTQRDPTTHLSGQAMLGIALARLPGRPLETYNDPATRAALDQCALRERKLREFFGPLSLPEGEALIQQNEGGGRCSALSFRPLLWDMTALALRWENKTRGVSVSKIESVDPQRHAYRASVRLDGIDHLVDVWLATDGGRLRLKLFDGDGRPAGLSLVQSVPASAFSGTWHRTEPRTERTIAPGVDADLEVDETLVVAVSTDDTARITHKVRRRLYFTGARRPACGGSRLDLGLEQSFGGALHEGSIVGTRTADAKAAGADMARCSAFFTYAPDRVAVLKRAGDKLLMVRTDGVAFPEVAEFER